MTRPVKLILHTGECRHEDDPSYPFKLELVMRPPSLCNVAFVCLYGGSEEVLARGETPEQLKQWMARNGLSDHPRLTRWKISGPEGQVAQYEWIDDPSPARSERSAQ